MNLTSKTWTKAAELLRKSRLSTLNPDAGDGASWDEAFDLTLLSISEERDNNPEFSKKLASLDAETGEQYDLLDCLESYFDHLEAMEKWEEVIYSCNRIFETFDWSDSAPSEFLFRKGNALEKLGRLDDAEKFGKKWLEQYPSDPYAGASNAFLLASQGRLDEAKALTEKYMSEKLVCDDTLDTLYMAAYRLVEMADNINAKQRVEKKLAELMVKVLPE